MNFEKLFNSNVYLILCVNNDVYYTRMCYFEDRVRNDERGVMIRIRRSRIYTVQVETKLWNREREGERLDKKGVSEYPDLRIVNVDSTLYSTEGTRKVLVKVSGK